MKGVWSTTSMRPLAVFVFMVNVVLVVSNDVKDRKEVSVGPPSSLGGRRQRGEGCCLDIPAFLWGEFRRLVHLVG